jgi:hypothetical protein
MAFMMKPARRIEWTSERIAALTTPDVRQLRVNAERLNNTEVVERCDAVLKARPRGTGPGSKPRRTAVKKLPRASEAEKKLPRAGEAA